MAFKMVSALDASRTVFTSPQDKRWCGILDRVERGGLVAPTVVSQALLSCVQLRTLSNIFIVRIIDSTRSLLLFILERKVLVIRYRK